MKYESREQLAAKADWEGGTSGLIFGYGLDVADLPDETPDNIRAAFARLVEIEDDLELINEWLFD